MLRSLSWDQTSLEPPGRPPGSLLLALESSEQGNSQALGKAAQLHAKPLPSPQQVLTALPLRRNAILFPPLMTFGCESWHSSQSHRDSWKLGFTMGSLWGWRWPGETLSAALHPAPPPDSLP